MRSGRPTAACVTILLLWSCAAHAALQPEAADALRARATQLIYEHQHDEAISVLRGAVAIAPDQSATQHSLASSLWLKMLFLRGAVTVDHDLGSFSRARVDLAKPPPGLVSEFQKSIMFALVLVYNRERRYDEARRTLQELRKLHPRNRLVLLEEGSTALRAGRPAHAERVLTEGLAMLAATTGPKIPGEDTLWRYKRGAARVALQQGSPDAAADEARQAEALCRRGQDPVCLDEAKKLLRTSDGR